MAVSLIKRGGRFLVLSLWLFKNGALWVCLFPLLFWVLGAVASPVSRLEWEMRHYGSDPKPDLRYQLRNYALLRGDGRYRFDKGALAFDSRIYTEYFLDKSRLFYFNIPELYFSYSYKLNRPFYSLEGLKFHLGRKAQAWSQSDDYWQLGTWNSLSQWNPLYPIKNGLIGSFLTAEGRLGRPIFL